MPEELKRRKTDGWQYHLLQWIIPVGIIIANTLILYGVGKTTVDTLCNDVGTLKTDCKENVKKITILETKFDYIAESLREIKESVNRIRRQ